MHNDEQFKDRYVLEESLLPSGFRLPNAYIELIRSPEFPDLTPWWLLGERKQSALFWLSTLKEQYPARSLIPFAKRDDLSDTLAAFDGSDTSGNPRVFHIHAYTEPGWEQRGTWDSFQDWLTQAYSDSAKFKADDE